MFTGNEEQEISFEEGALLTAKWRTNYPRAFKAGYISLDSIKSIIDQPDCVGIRIYFGQTPNDEMALVVVGVKAMKMIS